MECSKPGAIRDEELIAYLAGEKVRPEVMQHLASCESCSSQFATYRRMDLKLLKNLFRWDCPPSQVLGEYQLGMLSADYSTVVKNHLSNCVLCAAEVVTLTEFLENDPMLVERPAIAPVSVAIRPAQNNHHPVQEAKRALEDLRERSLAGVRRIIATLAPPQPQFALQRTTAVPAWPRRYMAEDLTISIQVERGTNRRDALQLIGFVTRKGAPLEALQDVPVQLLSQANTVYAQTIDELGNFVFSSIVPDTYSLELQLSEGVVVIEQLAVNAQD